MRWISIILTVFVACSCTALKPVINNKPQKSVNQDNNQPHFIENITVDPASSGSKKSAPSINNTAGSNPFIIRHDIQEAYNPILFKYAILMDMPVETLANFKLFAFIDEWYGVPYHFGGSNKTGIDCSAFAGNLMTTVFGVGLPRMAKDQYKACEHVKKANLEEGDLVFFHTTRKGISHVGVYLGNNKFVHASLNYGVTISDLGDGYYSKAFRGGGRVRSSDTVAGN
jgi:hypothetical protein